MVEIVFQPPQTILFIAIGILVLGVLSIFSKKAKGPRRFVGVVVTVIVVVVMLVVLYRPSTVSIGPDGVTSRGGTSIDITWDDVTNAYYEQNLPVSPYRPTVRTRGIVLGEYRSGRFLLSNGQSAVVLMERDDQAVVLVTDERTYLLAPRDIEVAVDAVNALRPIPPDK